MKLRISYNGFNVTIGQIAQEMGKLVTSEYYYIEKHESFSAEMFLEQYKNGVVDFHDIETALKLMQEYNFDVKYIKEQS